MATDLEYLQKLDNPEDRTRSLIDLIDVQTVDLELAAFLAEMIASKERRLAEVRRRFLQRHKRG